MLKFISVHEAQSVRLVIWAQVVATSEMMMLLNFLLQMNDTHGPSMVRFGLFE